MKRTIKKSLAAALAIVMCAGLLAGCSSGGGEDTTAQPDAALNIVVAANYVSDDALKEFAEAFAEKYAPEGVTVNWSAISMGDPDADPTSVMGGMTRITGMIMEKEIDVLIADPDVARRHGDNGGSYVALSDAFTADQLAGFVREALTLPELDELGEATGGRTVECGVDVTDLDGIEKVTTADSLGAYIMINAANPEQAKAFIEYVATN